MDSDAFKQVPVGIFPEGPSHLPDGRNIYSQGLCHVDDLLSTYYKPTI